MTAGTTEKPLTSGIPRRSFLKWSGIVGGGAALVGTGASFGLLPGVGPANAVTPTAAGAADTIVWSSCNVNCGSRCPLRMQVRDGQIVRVLPDDTGDNALGTQQIRACVRGRSIRHRIYNPDRLKSPMRRRPGTKRGAGQWDQITWEEAYDEIASTMQRLIKDYGNESIYLNYGTGTLGGTITRSWPPSETPVARLMNCVGGYLNHYGDYSAAQIETAVVYHYGGWIGSNSFDDAKNGVPCNAETPNEPGASLQGRAFLAMQVDPKFSGTAKSSCELAGTVDSQVLYDVVGADLWLAGAKIGVTSAIESLPSFEVDAEESKFRMIRVDGKYGAPDWKLSSDAGLACQTILAHVNEL